MKIEPKWKRLRPSGHWDFRSYVAYWRHVSLFVYPIRGNQRWVGKAYVGVGRIYGLGKPRTTPELAMRDAEALVPVLLCNLRDATALLLKRCGIDPDPQTPDGKD